MRSKKTVLIFIILIIFLLLVMMLSISVGSKQIGFDEVIRVLILQENTSFNAAIIMERIPRTIFGVLAGAALALSGCVMQAITRNPIADPSILGVNTGASLAVVIGIAFFSISKSQHFIWLALIGAFLTSIFVYGIASAGNGGATPLKLALAGAASATALGSLVNTIMLPNSQVMDQFRFWQTGSIGQASWETILLILPYLLVGFIITIALSGRLEILSLGDEMASGLGVNTKKTRLIGAFAGVLLCGATTALAGPIGFVGLMVPHLIKMVSNQSMKIILPLCALTGASLLLFSDIIGRIIARPTELEVGIVTAIIGAPVFIWIVRKARIKSYE